jgi:hypothetical protein
MLRVSLIVVLAVITGCGSAVIPQDTTPAVAKAPIPQPLTCASILRNIPTNSDKRCVGISVVAEALLDGVPLDGDGSDEAESIAKQIYGSLTTGRQLRYHRHVLIDGDRVPIDAKKSIGRLSTLVANHYKRDFSRLNQTEQGRQKLLAAEDSFVATSSELDQILVADEDKLDAFFGNGSRKFANGTVKDTHHTFLISKGPDGDVVVHDPNDPASPISCQVVNAEEGVTVQWTCKYKDTGETTTQRYFIVAKDRFFKVMLGE